MRLEKILGFVIYTFPLGEADQIITCFTSAGNLEKFVAKGSRKVKSRFAASVQLFNLGEYIIYRGKGLPYLRQAAIVDSFPAIRRDWQKSGAAFAVMELCRLLLGEQAGEAEAFKLALAYMYHLKTAAYHPLTFDAFRLQFAASLGYAMSFDRCAVCGQVAKTGSLVWRRGGLVCPRCRPGGGAVGERLPALLTALQTRGFAEIDSLEVADSLKQACAKAVDSLIFWLSEGKTKAQAFRTLFEDGF
ncbi:MAG: DNA repair protein RecO [Bacillota bacterium]|jgi:DNA repair protein RecO (recombination protein O)